jgi:chromosome partitioning protein
MGDFFGNNGGFLGMIISFVNQKGGVGKTTLAVNIAGCLHDLGKRIMVIDADPQGSLQQWRSIAEEGNFEVQHLPYPLLVRAIRPLTREYNYLVIDAPPGLSDTTRSVLEMSNLAIVPVGPSPLDIWSSRETVDLISEARRRNRKLYGRMLICRKIVRTRVGREARDTLKEFGVPVYETEISQRIVFVESMIAGLSVLQYAPRSEASEEVRGLCNEILQSLRR